MEDALRRQHYVPGDLAADLVQCCIHYRVALIALGVDLDRFWWGGVISSNETVRSYELTERGADFQGVEHAR